jgi:response regulator RpfG family c-di-GMP phosphodiesterase
MWKGAGAMSVRVLVVDTDEAVISTCKRLMRGIIEVEAVPVGEMALTAIDERGPFAVIVTEMGLDDMSGITLLGEVAKRAPETVSIMLTTLGEPLAVVNAINLGGVFRFLAKPCKPDAFLAAMRDAIALYQRRRVARELQSQAGYGIVQLLAGTFFTQEIELPEAAKRIRDRVRRVALAIKLLPTPELEVAALVMRLGMATIPPHVRQKLHIHEKLAPAEAEQLARIPEVVARLLEDVPRMAPVIEIIRHDGGDIAGEEAKRVAVRKDQISLSARVLRAVVDLEILETAGQPTPAALLRMQRESGRYDRAVLKVMESLFVQRRLFSEDQMEERNIVDLVAGNTLATDALSTEGVALVSAGTTLTPELIERLRNFLELGEVIEPVYVVRTRAENPVT